MLDGVNIRKDQKISDFNLEIHQLAGESTISPVKSHLIGESLT
jgi:hypothetical protein